MRERVFAAKGRRCWRCGQPATDVDHAIPLVEGGSDLIDNLRPACASCNRGRRG
jgi:5-methylcytosine-specific restriction endonuclease McrA